MKYKKTGIEWLDNIDWEMLKKQRAKLVKEFWKKPNHDVWGIIHLIDAIEDYMEDIVGRVKENKK